MSQLRHARVPRRTFLAAAVAFTACGAKRAPRYRGWLFVASAAEKAVVVADLSAFRRSGSIPLDAVPSQVLSVGGKLYAVCAESQNVAQIDPLRRTITGKIAVGGKIVVAALTTDGKYLAVATSQPDTLVLIDNATSRMVRRTALPEPPQALAVAATQAAVLLRSARLARLNIPGGELLGITAIAAGLVTSLGYRKDGETLFIAAPDTRQIISLDALSGAVLARLPVPIRPARFCASGNGGQVFVTGVDKEGQLVIFSPYQNQVDQTLYAGHALFGMAVAPNRNLLFLTNPAAGEVAILDIDTRRVESSIRTGGNPREILIASSPDSTTFEEYALAVDGDSGDISVIHIPTVLHKPGDAFIAEPPKPVFAVFHGGAQPQSAVIVPYSA
jgi:DNA-binding beta-propeller fold protein YncE